MSSNEIPVKDLLIKNKYISLITYKRDKTPIASTVWFVLDDTTEQLHRLYMTTSKKAGKLKRIHHTKEVAFAFCTASGKVKSNYFDSKIRELNSDESIKAHNLLKKKYGLIFKIWATFYLRKNARTYLEILF